MISLALNEQWDVSLTPSGSLHLVAGRARAAQDVASACRTFAGECWFNTRRGIPYFERILGNAPPEVVVRQSLEAEAATQPGVVSAHVVLSRFDGRTLQGKIRIVTQEGEEADVIL